MPDKIIIAGLEIFAHHGVLPEERQNGQTFLLDITLALDLATAYKSDDLGQTVDYGEVCAVARQVMTEESYDLLEAAAEAVCQAILSGFPDVRTVVLRLTKPHPPLPFKLSGAAVEISRRRQDARGNMQETE